MKKFLVIILLVTCGSAHGQVLGKFYYNKYWELTTKDSAVYIRMCVYDTTNGFFAGPVTDMYKSGQPQMKGNYSSRKKHGDFTFYHTNGKIESTGKFLNDERNGVWTYYHPNGQERLVVEYGASNFRKIVSLKDSSGVHLAEDGEGTYYESTDMYRVPEKVIITGKLTLYEKHGKWESYLAGGKKLYTENYSRGKMISSFSYPDGIKKERNSEPQDNVLDPPYKLAITESFVAAKGIDFSVYPYLHLMQTNGMLAFNRAFIQTRENTSPNEVVEIFDEVDESATPNVGLKAFYDRVTRGMSYPLEARRMNLQGSGNIQFVINENGSLYEAVIKESTGHPILDLEAMNSFHKEILRYKWTGAKKDGKLVKQRFIFSFGFRYEVRQIKATKFRPY